MDHLQPIMSRLRNMLRREPGANQAPHLSNLARLYIAGVCATGIAILLQFPAALPADLIGLVTFFILGSLAQLLPIRFYKEASVSMSMAVALAAIVVFGPIFAVWVNLGSGIVHYLTVTRPKHRPFYRSAVTISTLVIAAWVSGHLYIFANGQVGPSSVSFSSFLPLVLCGFCYYLLNTFLITIAMALEQRQSFLPLLRTNYQWLTVNIAGLTPLGFGVAFIYQQIGLGGLALFLVPVVIAQYSFHLYARTVENVRKANEELQEANDRIGITNEELREANEHVRQSNQELKEANDHLNVMYEVSRSLVGSLHVAETLNVISTATRLLGFHAGFVANAIHTDREKILYWRATHPAYAQWSLDEPNRATQTPLREFVVSLGKRDWFLAGEPRVFEPHECGLDLNEYQLSALADNPLAMLTLVPLFVHGEPWGIVGVGSSRPPSAIEMKELLIFRSMAENALETAIAHEQAERDAFIDARTGLFNHRYFQEALQRELHDAAQRNSFLSFLMLDINNFKEFNDMYGHLVGDQVLEIVAKLMRENVRELDIVCRYGGDELCVLLPQADRARAMEVAARIDRVIRTYPFHVRSENGFEPEKIEELSLRVSIGVATFPEAAQTRAGLVEQADRACYRAKVLGGGVVAEIGRSDTKEHSLRLPLVK
jgi:diguanylate cyclase (GGDEF)-like protein